VNDARAGIPPPRPAVPPLPGVLGTPLLHWDRDAGGARRLTPVSAWAGILADVFSASVSVFTRVGTLEGRHRVPRGRQVGGHLLVRGVDGGDGRLGVPIAFSAGRANSC
jgi:hypothetical protein